MKLFLKSFLEGIFEINGDVLFILGIILACIIVCIVILLIINACTKKKVVKKAAKAKPVVYHVEYEKLEKENQELIDELIKYGADKSAEIEVTEKEPALFVNYRGYEVCKVTIKEGVTKMAISVQNPKLFNSKMKLKPLVVTVNKENKANIKKAIDESFKVYKDIKK